MTSNAPHFTAWLDRFFASYYAERPVNATFIGEHSHDHRLPDWSDSGCGDTVAEMVAELDALERLPSEPLTPIEALDRRLARGFLRIHCWEYASPLFQRGNPSLHTGEAVFALLSLFLTDYAPLQERVEAARARMAALPLFLANARAQIREAPPEWTRRAIRECEGAIAFLGEGLSRLLGGKGSLNDRVLRSADAAARAFADHRHFLQSDLTAGWQPPPSAGEEAFDVLLREGHFLSESAAEVVAYARDQLARARAQLAASTAAAGGSEAEIAERLAAGHVTVDGYLHRYSEIWQTMRAHAAGHDLVTWPDFPLRYVPRPHWVRSSAPSLYFLFYRSPAAFARPPVHEYLVEPIEEDLDEAEQERRLRAHNDSVIKLNHVIHHGGIGHHVQNWHAFQAASRVGRIAAVDCASRIAMFCGGTMAEGWACYATDVMSETGALTADERVAEARSRIRMCARAIVDVELHHGRMTLDDATRFYEQTAGMAAGAASAEAVKNSMFPGAALMYLVGTDSIHALRQATARRQGSDFQLRAFHDRVLSYGSVPVRLVGELMEMSDAE